ncbi:MAG: mechanosensitive ion channel family protein, partial [Sphingopyxis sp.]|nr:mechanosensitive ion channel family protein [Sphingopyxis sp.]
VVQAPDHHVIRASFLAFGPSSLDFELVFDVLSEDIEVVADGRTKVGIDLIEALNDAGYELAYPTQTTYTAAPDGTLILPFFDPDANGPASPPKH